MKKIAFMFDAIDNADYAFKYATEHTSSDDLLVNESLNRITQILLQARRDAQQREKYYELIINSVDTGIIVIDEKGNVYQTNREALRL
ncbi:MAG: PAS domain S-box protein, partial [Bacteroidaceae bacterium]|nr:PAS domain S-box protein [Bacteroidaceae bacterium]